MGLLPTAANGNKYILCMTCELTKYLITVPISSKDAKTVAKAKFEKFVFIHGIMKSVKTDLGTEFKNQTISEVMKLLNASHAKSTPYRHETVGVVERNHRILTEHLRTYLAGKHQNWDEF